MSFSSSTYRQKAVLWALASYDAHGEPRVSSPQEVAVRWEATEVETVAEQEAPVPKDAEMWVASAVVVGSIVWLGALTDLPASPTGLLEVVGCSSVPDVKGRTWEYVLTLSRYKNSLRTVV